MDSNQLCSAVNLVGLMPLSGAEEQRSSSEIKSYIGSLESLAKSGFRTIELGPLASLSDDLLAAVLELAAGWHGLQLPVTVFDLDSMGSALDRGVQQVCVQLAPTNELSKQHFGVSISERLRQLTPVLELAGGAGVAVRGQLLSAFPAGCDAAGEADNPALVADTAFYTKQLMKMGCFQVALVDPAGIANVAAVEAVFSALAGLVDFSDLAVRFGDQNGQALINTVAALECGVVSVDVIDGGSEIAVSSRDLLFNLAGNSLASNVDGQQLATVTAMQERREQLIAEEQRLVALRRQPLRLVSSSGA